MFRKLKNRNPRKSEFENRANPSAFSKSPGVTTSVVKGNEKDRLIRCRHCGWICDLERDVKLKDGSYAGFGINHGQQRIGPSYNKYYGATLTTTTKNVLKNPTFTLWTAGGWNPIDPIGPNNWVTEETDGSDGRVETENPELVYCQMSVTVGEP